MFGHVIIEAKFEPSVNQQPAKHHFHRNQVIGIGRKEDNFFHFPQGFISGYHGALYRVDEKWYFEDFSSGGSILSRKGKRTAMKNNRNQVFENDEIILCL